MTDLSRPERPIQSDKEDALERGPFVRRLANALVDHTTKKATGVIIGITGPWGSGKSSILNLLRKEIKTTYPEAIVVSFDPWLVSGRDDLIAAFMAELITTIKAEPKLKKKLKAVTKTIAAYGKNLSPAVNLITPGGGAIVAGGLSAIESALSNKESLMGLRTQLMSELDKLNVPIVVLIDELDRVEDREIRTVAQLIRSVADFRGISYVLAYDHKRVIQALGEGHDPALREERGRSYLEKIVQLQIPLPIVFEEELDRLLQVEVASLQKELALPPGYAANDRYKALCKILTLHVIQTPRDIKRLVETFHALAGMVRAEVDWIDLLGYCALLTKAPLTVNKIFTDPLNFTEDALSEKAIARYADRDKVSLDDRLKEVVAANENNESTAKLLGFLFPMFSEQKRSRPELSDAICFQRPLLTTLRLGLLPGGYSKTAIEQLVAKDPKEIQETLQRAYDDGSLSNLVARLDDLYTSLTNLDHVNFWKGVGYFLRKPDCNWMTAYKPMHDVSRNLAEVLDDAVSKDPSLVSVAGRVFTNLQNADEATLTALWLRSHIFRHELFGQKAEIKKGTFLNKDQTEALAKEMSATCRAQHMSGKLIPCRWDLQPVYTMLDTSTWDDECRSKLTETLQDDAALDGLTLMLYGANFTTGTETVSKICNYQPYLERVRQRLASPELTKADPSVRAALEKAEGGGW